MDKTSLPSFAVPLIVVTCAVAPLLWGRATDLLRRALPSWSVASLAVAVDPTGPIPWAGQVEAPPRRQRRRRSDREERTRPVSTTVPPDPTEFEARPNGPVPVPVPIVGDVVSSGEQPLFDQDPNDVLNVVVNVSYARQEQGERAVRILDRRGQLLLQLTAAQAHQLAVDLQESADVVGGIRQAAGYQT